MPRLALMIDRETIERENKRLVARLKFARLRLSAVVEDINMKAPRSLDKALFQKLVAGDWIERHQNLLIIGQAGVGKSFIACALGHKACRDFPLPPIARSVCWADLLGKRPSARRWRWRSRP